VTNEGLPRTSAVSLKREQRLGGKRVEIPPHLASAKPVAVRHVVVPFLRGSEAETGRRLSSVGSTFPRLGRVMRGAQLLSRPKAVSYPAQSGRL
jgi:hypothetical protein